MKHSPQITRFFALFAASNLALFTMVALPEVQAATGSNYYKVQLKETAKKDKKIIRGAMIRCKGSQCRGKKANSASRYICVKVAKIFGPIQSFSAGDKVFDKAEIDKCNEKA